MDISGGFQTITVPLLVACKISRLLIGFSVSMNDTLIRWNWYAFLDIKPNLNYRLTKRGDQALISISTIHEFPGQNKKRLIQSILEIIHLNILTLLIFFSYEVVKNVTTVAAPVTTTTTTTVKPVTVEYNGEGKRLKKMKTKEIL